MDIRISQHAVQRMRERGISEAEVRKAFDEESWESVDVSDMDDSVLVMTKTFEGKKWRFLFNYETGTLVTCYPRR